jgi:hypothetical protein
MSIAKHISIKKTYITVVYEQDEYKMIYVTGFRSGVLSLIVKRDGRWRRERYRKHLIPRGISFLSVNTQVNICRPLPIIKTGAAPGYWLIV